MCSEQMDVTQARVLGSIPDFSRLVFLRPSHYLFFDPGDQQGSSWDGGGIATRDSREALAGGQDPEC